MRLSIAGLSIAGLSIGAMLVGAPVRAEEPAAARPAEDSASGPTKFYDFGELDLKGKIAKPTVLYTNAKERATFERLFVLKRSLLPELVRSAQGANLAQPPAAP